MAMPGVCFGQDLAELGLFLRFDSKPSPAVVGSMQTELKNILAPAAFSLKWFLPGDHFLAGDHGERGSWSRVVSVHFHGSCMARPGEAAEWPWSGNAGLGETSFADGKVIPYADVNCDRVRTFIDEGEQERAGEENRLGIAMGRILAHELYHVLLQTRNHGKKGIAKAVYTPTALLGRSLRFDKDELELIGSKFLSGTGKR